MRQGLFWGDSLGGIALAIAFQDACIVRHFERALFNAHWRGGMGH